MSHIKSFPYKVCQRSKQKKNLRQLVDWKLGTLIIPLIAPICTLSLLAGELSAMSLVISVIFFVDPAFASYLPAMFPRAHTACSQT